MELARSCDFLVGACNHTSKYEGIKFTNIPSASSMTLVLKVDLRVFSDVFWREMRVGAILNLSTIFVGCRVV